MKSNGKLPEYTPDPMEWVANPFEAPTTIPEPTFDWGLASPILIASIPTALNVLRGLMQDDDDA